MNERQQAHINFYLQRLEYWKVRKPAYSTARLLAARDGYTVVDELLEVDPHDTRHMFWEELRRISFVLRSVKPDDIDENVLEDFLSASDQLSGVLVRIEKRRQKRGISARAKLQI